MPRDKGTFINPATGYGEPDPIDLIGVAGGAILPQRAGAPTPLSHGRVAHPSNGTHGARPAMLPWNTAGRIAAPRDELPPKTRARTSGVRR